MYRLRTMHLLPLLFVLLACMGSPVRGEVRWLHAESDWEPDEEAARLSAEARLGLATERWLCAAGHGESERAGYPAIQRLLTDVNVDRQEKVERKDRPYGTVFRVRLSTGIRSRTVIEWKAKLASDEQRNRRRQLALAAAVLLSMVCGTCVYRLLDIWTRGYRRGACGAAVLMLLAAAWIAMHVAL